MPNLMMGKEGTQFHGDGVSVSWPKGGERGIVPAPAELSLRVKQRIAEGSLVLTDESANREAWINPASRMLTADEARERRRLEGPEVIEVNEPAVEAPVVEAAVAEAPVADAPAPKRTVRRKGSARGRRVSARRGRTSN